MYVCMNVWMCVCVYVCVCIYVWMYVCMYLCIYASMYLCNNVSMFLWIYVSMYLCRASGPGGGYPTTIPQAQCPHDRKTSGQNRCWNGHSESSVGFCCWCYIHMSQTLVTWLTPYIRHVRGQKTAYKKTSTFCSTCMKKLTSYSQCNHDGWALSSGWNRITFKNPSQLWLHLFAETLVHDLAITSIWSKQQNTSIKTNSLYTSMRKKLTKRNSMDGRDHDSMSFSFWIINIYPSKCPEKFGKNLFAQTLAAWLTTCFHHV